MEDFKVNANMSFEELVNAIKSLVMLVYQPWRETSIEEDAKLDFDYIVEIDKALKLMQSKFELEYTLKNNYRTHMIDEFKKRKSLEEKLQKINQESSGI